jgi:hypothetical protein
MGRKCDVNIVQFWRRVLLCDGSRPLLTRVFVDTAVERQQYVLSAAFLLYVGKVQSACVEVRDEQT